MSITRTIFEKLNESTESEVKKTFGDKPEEGSVIKSERHNVSVPKTLVNSKEFKSNKLENNNKQAGTVYANDTEKYMDIIDNKVQSDKGEIAKQTAKKSDKTVKFPYGNKVQASDSKLIKEGQDYDTRKYTNRLLDAVEDGIIDKDAVISACVNYMSEDDVEDMCRINDFMYIIDDEDEDDLDECDKNKLKECDKNKLKESESPEDAYDFLIKDEQEAIDGYNSKMNDVDDKAKEVFKKIIAEEENHIKLIQELKK